MQNITFKRFVACLFFCGLSLCGAGDWVSSLYAQRRMPSLLTMPYLDKFNQKLVNEHHQPSTKTAHANALLNAYKALRTTTWVAADNDEVNKIVEGINLAGTLMKSLAHLPSNPLIAQLLGGDFQPYVVKRSDLKIKMMY